MAIEFQKIRFKNFLSFGNVFTEIKLNNHKTNLIVGKNGHGKSTLLDALCFVLYNKPYRNINKPQLVNTINKKDMIVEVWFDIGSNKYHVRRGIKPNVFEVYQNGALLNQDAATKDYQDTLEKTILRLNFKSFCQIVILGSASFVPFMQLTPAHRKEIIDDILDLGVFSTMNVLLKEKSSELQKEYQKLEYKIDLCNEKIIMHEKHVQELQQNKQELIQENRDKITETLEQIHKENLLVEEYGKQLKELTPLLDTETKLKKKEKQFDNLKYQINDKIKSIKEEIDFFTNNDNCPTCKQIIDNNFKSEIVKEKTISITEKKEALEKIKTEISSVLDKINAFKETHIKIAECNRLIIQHNSNVSALNNYITTLNREIDKLSKTNTDNLNENEKTHLERDLESLQKDKEKFLENMELYKVAATILKDSGIKSVIIKKYIPLINKYINNYLTAMSFFAKFELNENFEETIKSRYHDTFTYASFSEGEKARLNLSILLAWRMVAKHRNSASTNILLLDEIGDSSLDSEGVENTLKILKSLVDDTNIFIISHKMDQQTDFFENVIKIKKAKNFSSVGK